MADSHVLVALRFLRFGLVCAIDDGGRLELGCGEAFGPPGPGPGPCSARSSVVGMKHKIVASYKTLRSVRGVLEKGS